ncbi:MAG: hypothetical protein CO094_13075 [Anaerolineae bacterium CG_4_9_14_3_um_filter_57_17]|nr:2Fe-2S iron-sulfur cluster binding domain-containing protein [bacterium]NCT21267.1 2Fe-2S iron-sulfur cluster binding domain-containing protein [bacterium]PJB64461.1 MAG: hypothetical protein CO094_13075 [Anaerolineae bacterium CG_4_9_14_3_um_filter_57_17]
MWQTYFNVTSLQEAVQLLAERAPAARIVAGGTDLLLELERGLRPNLNTLIDVTRIPGLDEIRLDENGIIHLGALVTHNAVVASGLLHERARPLAQAAWEVGSPQIRNRGTLAGNIITASPANDTITPLMALDARLTLLSPRGERVVPLREFYSGVRKTVMQADEILTEISFRALTPRERGIFIKLALRRAQAISLVNIAIILRLNGDTVEQAAITLGAVAPTIIHARAAEAFLTGKPLSAETIARAAELVQTAAKPIDDVRASAGYRRHTCGVIARRGLEALLSGQNQLPAEPVLLWGQPKAIKSEPLPAASPAQVRDIHTKINGKNYIFTSGQEKSLLRLLREEAGLTGTKEGCAEGECGACTVFLDGKAVMACLTPAPRADGAEIVTVEGLATDGKLHPVQAAFVQAGAVQCGYCTPGFVMSAVKLLEARPRPTKTEIEQALTGNLCRCTGYAKIIQAVETASRA